MKRTLTVLAAALCAALAGPAAAQNMFRFGWKDKPSHRYWMDVEATGLKGEAVISCAAARDGRISDCRTLLEAPKDSGAAAALIAAAPMYRLRGIDRRCAVVFNRVILSGEFPSADTNVDWKTKPSGAMFFAAYPPRAVEQHVWGAVAVHCRVETSGALTACTTVSEDPQGMGFGAAALSLIPSFYMTPAVKGGVAVPSTVTIPINFVPRGTWCPTG